MHDDLLRWRDEFPILARTLHLASHTLGAMPRAARARAAEFLDLWDTQGVTAWETWLPFLDESAAVLEGILGAAPGTVALNQNVSTLQAVVASCLDFAGPRRRVVYSDLEFHSVHYVWKEQERRGAEVVVVPSDGVRAPVDALAAAIDERTAIVPVSHVTFRTAALADVRPIVARAHAAGALVFLDCYQSAGTVPFSLAELGVDLACGGSVKWLCGGPGAAWLYVRPELIDRLEPALTGWFAHAAPFAFEMERIERARGIRRFAGGTPPVPAFYVARAGWDVVRAIGVEAIRAKSLRQTAAMIARAEALGFEVRTPRAAAERGGTVCLDGQRSKELCDALLARGVLCDHRPGAGLRVAPHFYTSDEEIDRFFALVAAASAPP